MTVQNTGVAPSQGAVASSTSGDVHQQSEAGLRASLLLTEKALAATQQQMSFFLIMLTLISGIIVSAGAVVFVIQNLSVQDTIQYARNEVERVVRAAVPQSIDSITVDGTHGDGETILATPSINVRSITSDVNVYDLSISLQPRIKFEGVGTNHINAINLKIDEDFVSNFYGERQFGSAQSLRQGLTFALEPILVTPGHFYAAGVSVNLTFRTCNEAEDKMKELAALDSFGLVEFTPVFDIPANVTNPREMRVAVEDPDPYLNCSILLPIGNGATSLVDNPTLPEG